MRSRKASSVHSRSDCFRRNSKAITTRSTTNTEAYECYLQARSRLFDSWGNRASVQSARQMFANAAEIDPGYARAHAGIATCDAFLWVQGDLDVSYEQMIANSSKALELAANLAEAHAARGAALYVAGHPEEAMTALETAIKLDPELFEAHYFRGFSCGDTGHLEDAASHFKRAAELLPEDYVSPALLGDVTETLGLHEQSQAALRQAMIRIAILLNRHPDHADGIAMGAANLAFLGEAGRAEKWAERSIALEPGNFGVRYNAACAYALIGKPALRRSKVLNSSTRVFHAPGGGCWG